MALANMQEMFVKVVHQLQVWYVSSGSQQEDFLMEFVMHCLETWPIPLILSHLIGKIL